MIKRKKFTNQPNSTVYNKLLNEEIINEGLLDGLKKVLIPIILTTIGMSSASSDRTLSTQTAQNKIEQYRDEIKDQAAIAGIDDAHVDIVLNSLLKHRDSNDVELHKNRLSRMVARMVDINDMYERMNTNNYQKFLKYVDRELKTYQQRITYYGKQKKRAGSDSLLNFDGDFQRVESKYKRDISIAEGEFKASRDFLNRERDLKIKKILGVQGTTVPKVLDTLLKYKASKTTKSAYEKLSGTLVDIQDVLEQYERIRVINYKKYMYRLIQKRDSIDNMQGDEMLRTLESEYRAQRDKLDRQRDAKIKELLTY